MPRVNVPSLPQMMNLVTADSMRIIHFLFIATVSINCIMKLVFPVVVMS